MTLQYLDTVHCNTHTKHHYSHGVYIVEEWPHGCASSCLAYAGMGRFAAYQYGRPTTLLGRSDTREGALAIATRDATIVRYTHRIN